MKDPKHLDEYIEFHSNCACGCGKIAEQVFRGIPIPSVNPMTHYRRYLERTKSLKDLLDVREGAGFT